MWLAFPAGFIFGRDQHIRTIHQSHENSMALGFSFGPQVFCNFTPRLALINYQKHQEVRWWEVLLYVTLGDIVMIPQRTNARKKYVLFLWECLFFFAPGQTNRCVCLFESFRWTDETTQITSKLDRTSSLLHFELRVLEYFTKRHLPASSQWPCLEAWKGLM